MTGKPGTLHPLPYESVWLRGIVERVIDGDTYHVRVLLGFHVEIVVPVRVRDVDTPELSTERGREVRQYVVNLLLGKPVLLKSYKDRQSFARWIAELMFQTAGGDWMSLDEYLVEQGWAVRVIG